MKRNAFGFRILAANFGQSNRTFAQGHFDYNGTVNLGDFNVLASRFRQSVTPDVTNRSSDKDTTDADDLQKLLHELI